jgi:hypothetical protein
MASSDSSSSPIPSWQFMVLLAAAFGAFLTSGKIGSLVPAADEPEKDRGSLVDAHLSDDPFGAWVRAAKNPDTPPGPMPGVAGTNLPGPLVSSQGLKGMIQGQRLCLLPIVVRGDFHSTEAREMRIRFRAAAVDGLGAQGLVADDPQHLLLIPPPPDWSHGTGRASTVADQAIPVEWFVSGDLPRHRPSPYGAVLVAWVQDQALFINPLATLESLKAHLLAQVQAVAPIDPSAVDFKVIGPYWSGTLSDMVVERMAGAHSAQPDVGSGITFYSATATIADGVLDMVAADQSRDRDSSAPGDDSGPRGRRALSRAGGGPLLVNLTCTDEELAEALLNELVLRGVDLNDENTRIAIISDWDTEYGRVLPLTFAAKLRQLKAVMPDYNPSAAMRLPRLPAERYAELKYDEDRHWPHQVLRAYYISGVGGSASTLGTQASSDDSGKSSSDPADPQPLERAAGEHQVDYIARLGMVFADRLTERDHPRSPDQKPAKDPKPKLRAIGLLGSSVDDEMLLLQVLRPHFPDAVFFTDKVDARFLDRGAAKYTRNLVVATTYGFELFQKLQVGAAPFRSGEQTGAFLAVQAAIGSQDPNVKYLREQLLPPLRYEIGRTHPVALFVPGRGQIPPHASDRFNDSLHPKFDMPRVAAASFWTYHAYDIACMMLGACFFGAMTLFVFLGRFRFEDSEIPDIIAGGLILAAVLAIVPAFNLVYDGFEPLSWSEGVSIWPTELFRVVAFLTACGSLFYCGSRVKRCRIRLCYEFGLVERSSNLTARRGLLGAVKEVLARLPLSEDDYHLTEEEDAAAVCHLESPLSNYAGAVKAAMAFRHAHPTAEQDEPPARYISAQILWRYLGERSMPIRRYARAGSMTVCYVAGWILLFAIFGIPASPTRGHVSVACDHVALVLASLSMVYLIFWVVDETQSCYRFVSRLGEDGQSLWPKKAFDRIPAVVKAAGAQSYATRKAASAYIEVLFIGKLTAEAVPLILLPAVVLTIFIFARWTFFANWHMSVSVLAFCGEDAGICALCALLLKNAATKAKLNALRRMALSAADARAAGAPDLADGFEALKTEMDDNLDGAFQPWHQQPFVKAILLPFGGTGIMQAIDVLMAKP